MVMTASTPPEKHSGSPKARTPLDKMTQSKKQLLEFQEKLDTLVDSMTKNPSILSRIATIWGKISLWQKVLGGLLLLAPPILLGALVQSITAYAIACVLLVSYLSISVLLDDHFTHTQNHTQDIKTGVSNLAEGMSTVLSVLEQISDALAEQVASFSMENQHFTEHLGDLKQGNNALSSETQRLRQTENSLNKTEAELAATCIDLQEDLARQVLLANETQQALTQLQSDFANNQQLLQEKNQQLHAITEQFQQDSAQYSQKITVLNETIQKLSALCIDRHTDREAFNLRLTELIHGKSLQRNGFFSEEKELAQVKKQLQDATERYEQLMSVFSEQIGRLEHLASQAY